MRSVTRVGVAVLFVLAACDAGRPSQPSGPNASAVADSHAGDSASAAAAAAAATGQPPPAPPYKASRGDAVLWKRHATFEADLMSALELGPDELCKELGERNCIRDIHVIALGGNDPFRSGINVPPKQPLSTTSIVVDRVLLSACAARARADKAGPAKVFKDIDLKAATPTPAAVDATISTLFQRLLARDPKPNESAAIKSLLEGDDAPASAEEFATLACFTIGSSLEFLFL